MARRLTLVAGGGNLVPYIADSIRGSGVPVQVLDLVGRGDLAGDQVVPATLDAPSDIIEAIRAFRPTHLVLAGGVQISDAQREGIARAFGLLGKAAGGLGDLGLAGAILLFCTANRIKLVGAHEVAPELLAPLGHIAGPPVDPEASKLAAHAAKTARAVGAIDLGQSVVLAGRRPVSAEDAGGTDALLARVAALRAGGLTGNGLAPLILAKARKPKQPAFVDLPAIGPQTVRNAAAAGIQIIAVEAKATLLLDRSVLEQAANESGVSIIGVRGG
jgi:DUF1009 family protein